MNISVVGAGLAGLTAAYTLCKNSNANVHIFESESSAGGRVQSRLVHGQNIDFGGFLMYPWYAEGHKLFDDLGIGDLLVKTPLSDIYYFLDSSGVAVKEEDVPFSMGEGLQIWMKSFVKILQTSSLSEPDLTLFDSKTISEYLRSTLGVDSHAGLYETFFDTVNQGYCYGPVDQSKTAFMAPIVRQVKFHGDIRTTSFFPQGSQVIVDHLVREITSLGGTMHYNTPITEIDGLTIRSKDQEFQSDTIVFAQTVSKELYASIMPNIPTECWYTHFITVAVQLPHVPIVGNVSNWGAAFYAPDTTIPQQVLSAINASALYGPELNSCIILNIIVRENDRKTINVNELQGITSKELRRLFPNIHNEEILDFVHWKQTMPVAQETFIQAIRDQHGKNGYYFAGDFLGAPSIETAIATGKKAANDVLANLS